MSFSFNFHDDDIEVGGDGEPPYELHDGPKPKANLTQNENQTIKPCLHDLDELLATLPSSISYAANEPSVFDEATLALRLPRRELFDIKAQLMAEDNVSSSDDSLAADLSSDIKPRVYEGGFKTWECSIDLARYLEQLLAERRLDLDNCSVHIIELGAGTAVPSATALFTVLKASVSTESALRQRPQTTSITLSDYNISVLQLATIPNMILSAIQVLGTGLEGSIKHQTSGELDTTVPIVRDFTKILEQHNVRVRGLSGGWGDTFTQLATGDQTAQQTPSTQRKIIILASETIYSPASLPEFVRTLVGLLSQDGETVAFLAAKKVYFGVGGGIDEFTRAVEGMGATVKVVWDSDTNSSQTGGGSRGVGRCIVEVRMVK